MSDIKQIIVIRKDLRMRRGKEVVQGSHASMGFIRRAMDGVVKHATMAVFTPVQYAWLKSETHKKICLQVDSEQELIEVQEAAIKAGLDSYMVTDAGLTEFDGVATKTALAIGPDLSEKIDPVTKHLKLY